MQTIDEAINFAAGELPEGCDLNIQIENGGWSVELVVDSKEVEERVFPIDKENIIESIVEAVELAKGICSYDCRDCCT
jgi:hypothetical protein